MPSDSLHSHPHCALVHCALIHCPLSHSLPSHPHCALILTALSLIHYPRVHCPLILTALSSSLRSLSFTTLAFTRQLICQAICEQYLDTLQTHDFDVFQPALQQPNYFSLQVTRHSVVVGL